MRSFLDKNRYTFLLIAIFLLAEVLVNPLGEFPLNDDWSYTKSLLILENEGRLDIGEWPAMTLASHLAWGLLFIKLFGFSFFVLRLSTLVASIIGLLVFSRMITELTGNKLLAFFGSLTLLFCPLYLNLSNTYMTDVNFNTLLTLCCYFALRYYQTTNIRWIAAFTISSAALVLMRQFGIIVPACFLLGCVFLQRRKFYAVLLSLACLVTVYLIFRQYELYLKELLPPSASYKFSGNLKLMDPDFYSFMLEKLTVRWKPILLTISLYLLPISIAGVPYCIRNISPRKVVLFAIFSTLFSILALYKVPAQIGNVFCDMSLGAETFYQSLNDVTSGNTHTWSPTFLLLLDLTKHLSVAVLIFTTSLLLIEKYRSLRNRLSPFNVFVMVLFFMYVFTLFVTESFFDRYTIPAITLAIIGINLLYSKINLSWKPAVIGLVLFSYVSIAGTHDYLTVNRTRWQAYHELRQQGVASSNINGGFEVNCWNDGNYGWWVDILTTDNFGYLIQYRTEPGFARIKAFPFKRTFPFSEDTIGIYKRQEQTKGAPQD